jgi:ribonuclease R
VLAKAICVNCCIIITMPSKKASSNQKTAHKLIYKGVFEISKSGMGFVIVEGKAVDIKIKPNNFGQAFNGDVVRVEVDKHTQPGKRAEGIIIDVAERKKTIFTGTLSIKGKYSFFIPKATDNIPDFHINESKLNGAKDGDTVVVNLLKWDKKDKKPEAAVMSVISAKNEADLAMKQILLDANFPIEFENDVLAAAEALEGRITREELRKRKDFRDVLTFTIDPTDAKDFDDAISIRNLDNGNYEIGVHIADVSHFVVPKTKLDDEAYKRATSVYLPDRVNPMLPEKISNELCSLRPNEDKYCFSAVFQITNRAEIKQQWIGRTVIHSNHRFTYDEVQQTIETGEGLHSNAILLLNKLAELMREERFKSGAISFSSTETRFVLDDDGKPIGVNIKESKEAHKLIEEFMLLANRTVAEYVSKIKVNKEPIPFSYRIHDTPSEEKLEPFIAFARKLGYKFDDSNSETIAQSFNELLSLSKGKPEQHLIEAVGIRTMAKAKYSTENIGHYGLGFTNYCHFTSPIRRYPDVLVHRVLQSIIDKNINIDKGLETKNLHCSERERAAMEAERASNKYKQVEYLEQFLGDEFDGVISGVSSFGFWVETVLHKCEGLVSIKDLSNIDDFKLNETSYSLVGMRTGMIFRMGDAVTIKVVAANKEKRQLDFELVSMSSKKPAATKKPTKAAKPKK